MSIGAIKITPGTLSGTIRAIPSKSQAHQVLICAALADRPTEVVVPRSISKDVETTMACLRSLGAHIKMGKEGRYRVEPIVRKGGKGSTENVTLQCGDNAATLHFLLPVAAALKEQVTFNAADNLTSSPPDSLRDSMKSLGCQFSGEGRSLTIRGRLRAGTFHLPGDVDTGYLSGLIMAASVMKDDSEVLLATGLESENDVDLTIEVLERYGVAVYEHQEGYRIPGKQNFKAPKEIRIEGDWSVGAIWLLANAIGGKVNCEGLYQKSVQGARKIVGLLRGLGDEAVIDCTYIPGLVPFLAVAASVSRGGTRLENAGRLRLAERDRLRDLAEALTAIGADVREFGEGLIITGREKLTGGETDARGDHRMAIALAIAATVCQNDLILRGAQGVGKYYPTFFDDYKKLGGKINTID